MKTIQWLSTFALLLGIFFTACQKDNNDDQSAEMISSEDQTTATNLFEDVDDQVDVAIETRGGGGDCPTVTIEPADGSYPRTMTVDFGTDGCEGIDGRIRKGKVIVTLSDTITQAGATRTATFSDYYVDEAHIEGTRTLVNQGMDANGNLTLSRSVTGAKITFPNGKVITWTASQTLTQTEGGNTPLILLDNVFEITGNSSGINRNGKAFSVEITEPLVKKRACFWLVSGSIVLTVEDKTASIDYGDGTCDRKATVTLPNGSTHEILIRRWW